jgi:hypothetical protein
MSITCLSEELITIFVSQLISLPKWNRFISEIHLCHKLTQSPVMLALCRIPKDVCLLLLGVAYAFPLFVIYFAQTGLCSGRSRRGQYLEARLEPMTAVIILKATLSSLHGAENIPWKFITLLTQHVIHIRYCYIFSRSPFPFVHLYKTALDALSRHALPRSL